MTNIVNSPALSAKRLDLSPWASVGQVRQKYRKMLDGSQLKYLLRFRVDCQEEENLANRLKELDWNKWKSTGNIYMKLSELKRTYCRLINKLNCNITSKQLYKVIKCRIRFQTIPSIFNLFNFPHEVNRHLKLTSQWLTCCPSAFNMHCLTLPMPYPYPALWHALPILFSLPLATCQTNDIKQQSEANHNSARGSEGNGVGEGVRDTAIISYCTQHDHYHDGR